MLADAGTTISTAAATPDWAQHEVTAHVPRDCRRVLFGIFLAGSGRIELREPELARGTQPRRTVRHEPEGEPVKTRLNMVPKHQWRSVTGQAATGTPNIQWGAVGRKP